MIAIHMLMSLICGSGSDMFHRLRGRQGFHRLLRGYIGREDNSRKVPGPLSQSIASSILSVRISVGPNLKQSGIYAGQKYCF